MKKLDEMQFSMEVAKRKGFDYFRANVKDLTSRGLIGYKENGKTVTPSESEIKKKFEELTGFKVEKEIK
jgi:hypothetical protein